MLQIIVWMLSFYMVLKGVELILIARNTPDERRNGSEATAYLSATAAILAALFFAYLANEQAHAMPSMPSLPTAY